MRGHTMDDFAHTKALWSDAAVVTYMSGKPYTLEECWTRFLRYRGHWSLLAFGYWVVEEKATGDFVGEVGFGNFKRDMEPPLGAIPELGWVLAPAKHGKGYATEAAKAGPHDGLCSFQCMVCATKMDCSTRPDWLYGPVEKGRLGLGRPKPFRSTEVLFLASPLPAVPETPRRSLTRRKSRHRFVRVVVSRQTAPGESLDLEHGNGTP